MRYADRTAGDYKVYEEKLTEEVKRRVEVEEEILEKLGQE